MNCASVESNAGKIAALLSSAVTDSHTNHHYLGKKAKVVISIVKDTIKGIMMNELTLKDLTTLTSLAHAIAQTVPFERTPEQAVEDLISLGMKGFYPDQLEDIALSTEFMRNCVPGRKKIPVELNSYVYGDLFRFISLAARRLLNRSFSTFASPCMDEPLRVEDIVKLHPFDVIRNASLTPLSDETLDYFLKPVLFFKYHFNEIGRGVQTREEAQIIASTLSGHFAQTLEEHFCQVRAQFQGMLSRPISMAKKMRYVYALGLLDAVSTSIIAPAKNVTTHMKRSNWTIEKYMRSYARDVRQSIKPVKRELARLLLDQVRSETTSDVTEANKETLEIVFHVAVNIRNSMTEFHKNKQQTKEAALCP